MALSSNSPNPDNSMQALKKYGGNIVIVILFALAGYFGWTYWQNNHARVDTVAADQYADIQRLNEEIDLASQNPDLEAEALTVLADSRTQLDKNIDTLVSTHGASVYAWQALMIKARQQVDNDDFASASATFKQALAIDLGDAGLSAITRLRYAETLLAAGKVDEALTEASSDIPSSFEGTQQELLGDIHLAKGDKDAAIKSYNNSWELLRKRQENRAVLALKMESLGLVPKPIDGPNNIIQASATPEGPVTEGIVVESESANAIPQPVQ